MVHKTLSISSIALFLLFLLCTLITSIALAEECIIDSSGQAECESNLSREEGIKNHDSNGELEEEEEYYPHEEEDEYYPHEEEEDYYPYEEEEYYYDGEWWDHPLNVSDLWERFECEEIFSKLRPIHSLSTWMTLRNTYYTVVGKEKSSITITEDSGFQVPIEARQAEEKGRGVFASDKIPKGAFIWTAKTNSARFDNGPDYRRFLGSIPRDVACDVLQWAYVENIEIEHDGKNDHDYEDPSSLRICVDLDDGSFMNSAYVVDGETPNIGCDPEAAKLVPGGCKDNLFALSDIDKDEELLCHYGDFAIPDGWKVFDL